jgi:transaldolase
MKFFPDTADLDEIRKGVDWGIVDGVTTNPTLIAKEGKPIREQIAAICEIVGGPVNAEVVAVETKDMIREGNDLAKIHGNVIVKCPMTRNGIEAGRPGRISSAPLWAGSTMKAQTAWTTGKHFSRSTH